MIYLIEQDQYYKIGYTSNLERRMKEYSTHNINFKLISTIEGDRTFEQVLHEKFKALKYNTEWFYKNSSILDYFQTVKGIKEISKDFIYTFPESLPLTTKLTEASLKVLNYVVLNASFAGDPPIGNVFNLNGFYTRIIEATGLKKSAVTKAFKVLTDLELLIKDKKVRGVYYVNPLYFWKGKLSDRLKSVEISTRYILE